MQAHVNLRRGSCDTECPYVRSSARAAIERRRGPTHQFRFNLKVLPSEARCTLARRAGWRGAQVRKLARLRGCFLGPRAARCMSKLATHASQVAKSHRATEQLKREGSGGTQGPQPSGAGRFGTAGSGPAAIARMFRSFVARVRDSMSRAPAATART
jgi:hypothetical protein